MIDHIYCINLRRRADRWRRMAGRLRRRGLVAERFLATDGMAVDASTLPPSIIVPQFDSTSIARWAKRVEPNRRRTLSAGEIGCALSHLGAWNDVLDKGYEVALVVEDDVDFASDFVVRLRALRKRFPARWDLVYLGWDPSAAPAPRAFAPGLGVPVYHFGTFGYLVSRRGAGRLLELLPVREPIDTFLAGHFPDLRVLCAVPQLILPQPRSWNDSNVEHSAVRPREP